MLIVIEYSEHMLCYFCFDCDISQFAAIMMCWVNCLKLILQMTVVEAYFGGTKLDPCYDMSQLSANAASLIIEGIAQNTTGTVFLPEVQKSKPPTQ